MIIIFIVLAVIMLFIALKAAFAWSDVLGQFRDGNCLVYGRKGKGKDLLFAAVINRRKREKKGKHYSNIRYNSKTEVMDIGDIKAGDNTYNDFINGTMRKFNWSMDYGTDYYLSEAGLNLPCQYNNELNKRYPSLPIAYALTRHLGKNNIHINSQALTRSWDKIREQADCFIRCMRTIWFFPFFAFIKVRLYDEYEDAKQNLKPLKIAPILDNRESKALKAVENSNRGNIREYWLPVRKKHIEYDTRHFGRLLLLNFDSGKKQKHIKNKENASAV